MSLGRLIFALGIILILVAGFFIFNRLRGGAVDTTTSTTTELPPGASRVTVADQSVIVQPDPNIRRILDSERITSVQQVEIIREPEIVPTNTPEPAEVQAEPTPVPPTAVPPTAIPPTAVPPTTGEHGFQTYVVQSGDTLWSIAQRFGTTVQHMAEHDIASGDLVVGNTIYVPNESTTNNVVVQPVNCATARSHTVVSGDNVFRLSMAYGVTEEGIRDANGLALRYLSDGTGRYDYQISVGQVLCIPDS